MTPEWATAAADARNFQSPLPNVISFLLVDKVTEKVRAHHTTNSLCTRQYERSSDAWDVDDVAAFMRSIVLEYVLGMLTKVPIDSCQAIA